MTPKRAVASKTLAADLEKAKENFLNTKVDVKHAETKVKEAEKAIKSPDRAVAREAKAELKEAKAELKEAKAELKEAKAELKEAKKKPALVFKPNPQKSPKSMTDSHLRVALRLNKKNPTQNQARIAALEAELAKRQHAKAKPSTPASSHMAMVLALRARIVEENKKSPKNRGVLRNLKISLDKHEAALKKQGNSVPKASEAYLAALHSLAPKVKKTKMPVKNSAKPSAKTSAIAKMSDRGLAIALGRLTNSGDHPARVRAIKKEMKARAERGGSKKHSSKKRSSSKKQSSKKQSHYPKMYKAPNGSLKTRTTRDLKKALKRVKKQEKKVSDLAFKESKESERLTNAKRKLAARVSHASMEIKARKGKQSSSRNARSTRDLKDAVKRMRKHGKLVSQRALKAKKAAKRLEKDEQKLGSRAFHIQMELNSRSGKKKAKSVKARSGGGVLTKRSTRSGGGAYTERSTRNLQMALARIRAQERKIVEESQPLMAMLQKKGSAKLSAKQYKSVKMIVAAGKKLAARAASIKLELHARAEKKSKAKKSKAKAKKSKDKSKSKATRKYTKHAALKTMSKAKLEQKIKELSKKKSAQAQKELAAARYHLKKHQK